MLGYILAILSEIPFLGLAFFSKRYHKSYLNYSMAIRLFSCQMHNQDFTFLLLTIPTSFFFLNTAPCQKFESTSYRKRRKYSFGIQNSHTVADPGFLLGEGTKYTF